MAKQMSQLSEQHRYDQTQKVVETVNHECEVRKRKKQTIEKYEQKWGQQVSFDSLTRVMTQGPFPSRCTMR